jgi:hypothetical protein
MSTRPHTQVLAAAAARVGLFAGWLAAGLGQVGSTGCSGGTPGASPEAAVAELIAAARSGDRAAVYQRLGPRTRGRIEEILAAARKSGGARLLRPEDLVTVGWVPPAWEATSIHELRRQGDDAEVDVASAAGDHQAIILVREGKRWMVELPQR